MQNTIYYWAKSDVQFTEVREYFNITLFTIQSNLWIHVTQRKIENMVFIDKWSLVGSFNVYLRKEALLKRGLYKHGGRKSDVVINTVVTVLCFVLMLYTYKVINLTDQCRSTDIKHRLMFLYNLFFYNFRISMYENLLSEEIALWIHVGSTFHTNVHEVSNILLTVDEMLDKRCLHCLPFI